MEDLEPALHKSTTTRVKGAGSCSALIKLLPGNKDLYVSQDTWDTYNSMLRILKKYTFPYKLTSMSSGMIICYFTVRFNT